MLYATAWVLRALHSKANKAAPSTAPAVLSQALIADAWNGISSNRPVTMNATRMPSGITRSAYPVKPAQTNQIPAIESAITSTMLDAQPKRIAVQPAAIGSVFAMVAATNAAVAIGGVMSDITPK